MSEKFAQTSVATMAAALVAVVAFASLPVKEHATGVTADGLRVVGEVTPQGWGFFTRDPRQPTTQAWVQSASGGWHPSTRGPSATLKNAFGLDRSSRLDEYDVSQVLGQKDIDELWTDCTGSSIRHCAQRAEMEHGVQSWRAEGYDLRLCGDVLFLDVEPIPIDFAGLQYDPPKKAIRAEVSCRDLQESA